jgi:phosphonate transport system permease protein
MFAMSRTASTELSSDGIQIERHWQELAGRRRAYSWIIAVGLLVTIAGSLWFANESNAGKFFDRLPHLFDFAGDLVPRDGWEVWRAMFDLPSPYFDGSLKYDYPEGRVYLFGGFYMPEYFYKMLETLNIAILATLAGFIFGFMICFLAAKNLVKNRFIRFAARRYMEILRAFPEIVIAGFFAAILSTRAHPCHVRRRHPYDRGSWQAVLRSRREC